LKPTFKKSSCGQSDELCPNLPECSIPAQKIDIDNKARFRYQVGYWFRLIDASISGASAEADTQFSIFDSSTLKKQLLIFFYFYIRCIIGLKLSIFLMKDCKHRIKIGL
jgi:hypothetical protein